MAEVDATRACVVCGALFARYKTKSVCSDACAATRQREYQSRSDARKPAIVKQCKWCAAEFTPRNSAVCCCAEHARLLKLKRDRDRDVAPEQRAAWSKTYSQRHADKVRERGRIHAAKNRAKHGRGDRSVEYAAQRTRRLGPTLAAMLWLDVCYYAAHAEALAMNAEFDRAVRKRARSVQKRFADSAEEWRWKYRNDPEFRQAQIQRLKAQKIKRKKQTEFGMTKEEALAVYAERSSCLYCGCRLDDKGKVLDHMDPLSKGGAHDASNLAVACRSCNTRKAAKLFIDWLLLVPEARRAMVAKVYAKKHGAPAEQGGLMLAMKAA